MGHGTYTLKNGQCDKLIIDNQCMSQTCFPIFVYLITIYTQSDRSKITEQYLINISYLTIHEVSMHCHEHYSMLRARDRYIYIYYILFCEIKKNTTLEPCRSY